MTQQSTKPSTFRQQIAQLKKIGKTASPLVKVSDDTDYLDHVKEETEYYDEAEKAVVLSHPNPLPWLAWDSEAELTPFDDTLNKKAWRDVAPEIPQPFLDYLNEQGDVLWEMLEDGGSDFVETKPERWLVDNGYADVVRFGVRESLEGMTVAELKDLCPAYGVARNQRKNELIEALAPLIDPASIPDGYKLNGAFVDLLAGVLKVYATEAAKALDYAPMTVDEKVRCVFDGLEMYEDWISDATVRAVIEAESTDWPPLKLEPKKPSGLLSSSEGIAWVSIGLGTVLIAGFWLFLNPDLPWWAFLILWVMAVGGFYKRLLRDQSNAALLDRL